MSTVHCAVWGRPVAHSLSPVLHAAAYDALGLAGWSYTSADVGEAELPGALEHLDGSWRGLSLTMPLKRAVMPLLDDVSAVAGAAGAVNTVLLHDGRRTGDNTDVPGMVRAIRERRTTPPGTALVVGGGATAASTLLALADLGCPEVVLVVRDPVRAAPTLEVAARRGAPAVRVVPLEQAASLAEVPADLLVGTVPARAWTPALLAATAHVPLVFEMVYEAWPTPLARAVDEAGADRGLVSPLDLLVHQALLQVGLMTGLGERAVAGALRAMREAGERVLAERASAQ